MIVYKNIKNLLCFVCIFLITACGPAEFQEEVAADAFDAFDSGEPDDPLDGFNRAMMELNFFLDDYLLQPAATAYKALTPDFIQTGVGNFTQYIKIPFYMANDILQWKWDHFAQNFWVMTVNTFSGLGLINGAGYFEVYAKPNDFGITLHQWGLQSGPMVTLPILGPTYLRDIMGSVVGFVADPVSIVANYNGYREYNYAITALGYVHTRSLYLGQLESLRKESYDPYITIKSIIEQKRESELKEHE
jgi:phospholipid-binding lipoprotein MlaA